MPPDRYPDALPRISAALRNIELFELSLDALGCFGGRQRGVLYVYASAPESLARLQQLQGALEAAMPMCDDQRKAGGGSEFVPHMTICHYASRAEAEEAKARLEASDEWRPTTFRVADAAVHVMLRQGDSGQFERARLSFCATRLDPPARFAVCRWRRRGEDGGEPPCALRAARRAAGARGGEEERECAPLGEQIAEIRRQFGRRRTGRAGRKTKSGVL